MRSRIRVGPAALTFSWSGLRISNTPKPLPLTIPATARRSPAGSWLTRYAWWNQTNFRTSPESSVRVASVSGIRFLIERFAETAEMVPITVACFPSSRSTTAVGFPYSSQPKGRSSSRSRTVVIPSLASLDESVDRTLGSSATGVLSVSRWTASGAAPCLQPRRDDQLRRECERDYEPQPGLPHAADCEPAHGQDDDADDGLRPVTDEQPNDLGCRGPQKLHASTGRRIVITAKREAPK